MGVISLLAWLNGWIDNPRGKSLAVIGALASPPLAFLLVLLIGVLAG
jgi:hypothetical protein